MRNYLTRLILHARIVNLLSNLCSWSFMITNDFLWKFIIKFFEHVIIIMNSNFHEHAHKYSLMKSFYIFTFILSILFNDHYYDHYLLKNIISRTPYSLGAHSVWRSRWRSDCASQFMSNIFYDCLFLSYLLRFVALLSNYSLVPYSTRKYLLCFTMPYNARSVMWAH